MSNPSSEMKDKVSPHSNEMTINTNTYQTRAHLHAHTHTHTMNKAKAKKHIYYYKFWMGEDYARDTNTKTTN